MVKIQFLKPLCVLLIFFQVNVIAFEQHDKESMGDSTRTSVDTKSETLVNIDKHVTWHKMFTNVPSDYSIFFLDSFKKQAISTYITIGALTGTLILVDEPGWKSSNLLYKRYQPYHSIADVSVKMGDGRYQFLTAALFAIPGVVFHNETALRTGSNIAEAVISTGLLVQILKRVTGRESPSASTQRGGEWDPFPSIKQYQQDQPAYYSFPSGHLSTATAIITVIANNYPDEKWIKPVSYPILGLLGVSLVSKGMHWYSDLPLAYFLGYSFGNIIAPERKSPTEENAEPSLTIAPSINYNGLQLGMKFRF